MKLDHVDGGNVFDWGKTSRDYAASVRVIPRISTISSPGWASVFPGRRFWTWDGHRRFGQGVCRAGRDRHWRGYCRRSNSGSQTIIERSASRNPIPCLQSGRHRLSRDSFDVVSAGQSWMYFDTAVLVPKLRRMLRDRGRLVLTHLNWLPRRGFDRAAERSAGFEIQSAMERGGLRRHAARQVLGFARPVPIDYLPCL